MSNSDFIKKLPLINSDNKKVKILGYVLYAWLGLSILGTILPTTDTSLSENKTAETWYEDGLSIYEKNINELDDPSSGDYAHALEAFNRAIEIDPKNITYLAGKAVILDMMERYSEAVETCDDALNIRPNCYSILIDKSQYLLSDNKPNEALQAAENAIEINPDALLAWARKSDALYELGREADSDQADAVYNRLSNRQNAIDPLTQTQLSLIKKWYPIGVSFDDIALDIGAIYYEPRVSEAVDRMVENGELVRRTDGWWR